MSLTIAYKPSQSSVILKTEHVCICQIVHFRMITIELQKKFKLELKVKLLKCSQILRDFSKCLMQLTCYLNMAYIHKIHPGETGPYLCCIPKVQPVSSKGGHGGSGVNLQLVVWSSLIFTLPDTKAKLWVCLCLCCEWNAAYINRLNLTCQTLQTALKHHGAQTATRERVGRGWMTPCAEWCSLTRALPSADMLPSL